MSPSVLLRWEDKEAGSPVATLTSAFATHPTCDSPQHANSHNSPKSEELQVDPSAPAGARQ